MAASASGSTTWAEPLPLTTAAWLPCRHPAPHLHGKVMPYRCEVHLGSLLTCPLHPCRTCMGGSSFGNLTLIHSWSAPIPPLPPVCRTSTPLDASLATPSCGCSLCSSARCILSTRPLSASSGRGSRGPSCRPWPPTRCSRTRPGTPPSPPMISCWCSSPSWSSTAGWTWSECGWLVLLEQLGRVQWSRCPVDLGE